MAALGQDQATPDWLRFADLDEGRIEYQWIGPGPDEAPTLVFLHEGLGSVELWRGFPERVAAATGLGAVVYSRFGYGRSAPSRLPRSTRFMHDEALDVLPRLVRAWGLRDFLLVGHSDGGSIALIYAGAVAAPGLKGVITEAAHIFLEPISTASIRAARDAFENGDLARRLARYHGANTNCAFWGWAGPWLDGDFTAWSLTEYLPTIPVPVLAIQGEGDEYGTVAQLDGIVAQAGRATGPGARRLLIPDCRHSPHLDRPDIVLDAMTGFIAEVLP